MQRRRVLLAAAFTAGGIAAAASAGTGPTVENAWARAPIGAAGAMALYLTVRGGTAPDRLVGVDCDIAAMAMLHESSEQNGMSSMHMLAGIDIPAGTTVMLRPGGMHVMLEDLRSRPAPGQSIGVTLHFRHAGDTRLLVPVGPPGASGP